MFIGLNNAITGLTQDQLSKTINSLFSKNEQGVWFDPSDFSTMFQDAAGTTPVTAVEQPVGLMLDKSKGLVLGPELVTNGGFDTDTSGWTPVPNISLSVVSGALRITPVNVGGKYATAPVNLVSGRWYQIKADCFGNTSDTVLAVIIGSTVGGTDVFNSGGFYSTGVWVNKTYYFVSNYTGDAYVGLRASGVSGYNDYDNISVRELPGNHAYQSTSASRPVLSARVNLFKHTEDYTNSSWLRTAGVTPQKHVAVAPDGTTTAGRITATAGTYHAKYIHQQSVYPNFSSGIEFTYKVWLKSATGTTQNLSLEFIRQYTGYLNKQIAVDAVWREYEYTVSVPTSGTGLDAGIANGSAGEAFDVYIWHPDLRPANSGVNLPPYQRVGASTDYDTAGFPAYLKFDGIDDYLVTNNIDFTATDKMTVCAGVRKLSDDSVGMLLELSPNINTTTGAFYLAVPDVAGASGDYAYASRGTTVNIVARAAIKAPSTVVVTGTSSIASRSVILRINGAQAAASSGTGEGTGNYRNSPLYIGRRGGTTLPFNGQLYGLVIRGALSSTGEIQGAESYMNLHTGAY